ncbi:MAG TPA: hypothetical protein VGH09_06480 [Solirubrobacteraceae bacterium]
MAATRLTRRSLIFAAGGALTARLASPTGALAALAGPPPPALDQQTLGALTPGVHAVALARNADLVGLAWRGRASASVRVRFRDAGGRWSAWVSGAAGAHGPDRPPPAGGRVVGEPVWTGGTRLVQLHVDRPLPDASLQLIDVSAGAGAAVAARAAERSVFARVAAPSLPLATPMLQAGSGQPAIISRAAWARGSAPPRVSPEYGAVRLAFVHHTENPNGYSAGEVPAMLRAIYIFHRYVHGWNDIGYNFVVDAFGRSSRRARGASTSRSSALTPAATTSHRPASPRSARSWARRSRLAREPRCSACSRGSSRCTACPRAGT